MKTAPTIEVHAPIAARARYLVSTYRDLTLENDKLMALLVRIPGPHSRGVIDNWLELARDENFETLAIALIEAHYDPAYRHWTRKHPRSCLERLELRDLSRTSINSAASRVLEQLHAMESP